MTLNDIFLDLSIKKTSSLSAHAEYIVKRKTQKHAGLKEAVDLETN